MSERTSGGRIGEPIGRLSNKGYLIAMTVYMLVVSAFTFKAGGFLRLDTVLLFMLIGGVIIGGGRTFLRDWVPFVVLFLAWQMLAGYADNVGFKAHNEILVRAERLISFGYIPTVVLQEHLYVPGKIQWYDIMATTFWAFHFVLPILYAFMLWVNRRDLYWKFVNSLLFLSFAGFLTYMLFPAVPPWLASYWGTIPQKIYLIRDIVLSQLHFGGMSLSMLIKHGNPNYVAAMPSLHAAYPTLVFVFSLFHWRKFAPIALLYCFGLWFSIIYIGDHYVIDTLAGIAYAVVSFIIVSVIYRYLEKRREKLVLETSQAVEAAG